MEEIRMSVSQYSSPGWLYKLTLSLCTCLMLVGCVTQPTMSREEWLQTTTREYRGVTVDQVAQAAEQIFRLADGNDFTIVHSADGLYASRSWLVYLVLAASMGTDHWKITVVPTEGGVTASAYVSTQIGSVAPMATAGGDISVGSTPTIGQPVNGTAIYDVLWARMDYMLGLSPSWMTCQEANLRIDQKLTWGSNEALCNSFNIKDDKPQKPMIAYQASAALD